MGSQEPGVDLKSLHKPRFAFLREELDHYSLVWDMEIKSLKAKMDVLRFLYPDGGIDAV
jgi:hypothetical protein